MKNLLIPTALSILIVAGAACGGGGAPTSPSGGNAVVMLQDSPFSDAKAVLVTFSEVSAHKSGADFFAVPFAGGATSRTCDLKKLVGAQDVLGTGSLPEGHYTQIRVVVSSAAIYFDAASSGPACATSIPAPSGRSAPVDVPSGEVKLNREFGLTSTATTITLDFDGDRSILQTGSGKYKLQPVIAVLSVQ